MAQGIYEIFLIVYQIILTFLRTFIHYPMKEPEKHLIVITGCDSGIGWLLIQQLTERNYYIIALCLTAGGIKQIEDFNKEHRAAQILPLQCDVTKEEQLKKVYLQVEELLARDTSLKLWAIVNNAGIAPVGFLDWLPIESFRQVMEVNYFAIVTISKLFLPLLKKTKYSRIINLSSLAGISGFHTGGAYCGSKHAIEGFTKCLRLELLSWNVYVTNINPGFMRTPLIHNSTELALQEFARAPKEITDLYPLQNATNLTEGIKAVEESPMIAVHAVMDNLTRWVPLLNTYPGKQGFLISTLMWILPNRLKSLLDFIVNYGMSYGPYPEAVEKIQQSTK